jgi:hypothetical protein
LGRLLKLIAEGTRTEETRAEALAIATEITPLVFNENTKVILGGIDQLSPEQFIGLLASPCFEDNLTGEQAWHLRDINCPTLALYGSRDVQVPAKEHIETVGEILGEDSTHDFRVVELPFANHLFQRCETGFPREYFSIDHDIAPDALEVISEWITRKMKPDNNFDMRYRV